MATTVSEIELFLHSDDASWCYEKWEQLPEDGNRYEVIDGVLYMTTSPSVTHQRVVARLTMRVGAPLDDGSIARFMTAPVGVIMPGADPVQPDFLLIRAERMPIIASGNQVRGAPDLIAEVLSPGNPRLDTTIKRAAYARAGVPEYWMLRPESRDILVCTAPDPELADFTEVRHFTNGEELISPTLPIRVPVAVLFED
jgi:Uma2 family endonuclease